MKLRHLIILPVLAVALPCLSLQAYAATKAQNKFRLKPGAQAKVCLGCHSDFQEKLKNSFIHTPVKNGSCPDCHNPHTSNYDRLLGESVNRICFTCHTGMVPKDARSAHAVVVAGACTKCHDPHAAKNKFNLKKSGNELCFECHTEMGVILPKNKFKHSPVEKNCLNCHDPHASAKNASLLKQSAPALCKSCHKTDTPAFAARHANYPVANAQCNSCHNPHGSDKAGILFNNVHKPVAGKMCGQCHEGPSSPNPLKLKRPAFDLCNGCHSAMVNDMFNKNRLHWPVVGKDVCLNCHVPHASAQSGLLKGPMISLCGTCHADTIVRQEKSLTKHEPMKEGVCTYCHSPHASNAVLLLTQPSVIELCGTCHEWQKHVTHVIGDKVKDPRDKNLTLDCLSCHRAHGTEYKTMIPYPSITDLCLQCHEKFKR